MATAIFNNDLVLSNILSFLPITDALKVYYLTDHRETVHYALKQKMQYKTLKFLEEFPRLRETLFTHLFIPHQVERLNNSFDFLAKNKWFLKHHLFGTFAKQVETVLVQLVVLGPYLENALKYLTVLFGIEEQHYDHVSYIVDTSGTFIVTRIVTTPSL